MPEFKEVEAMINGIKDKLGDKAVDVSEDLVKLHGAISNTFEDLTNQQKINKKVTTDLSKAQKTNSELAANLMAQQAFHEEEQPKPEEKPSLNTMIKHAEENV